MTKLLWTQRQDIGPSARFGHALAFDQTRKRTVLFGGVDASGAELADTWAWDGEAWTQVGDMGPAARAGHQLVFQSGRGCVLLFGGASEGAFFGDTWEWDGEAWTQVDDTGPTARGRHGLAYDSIAKRVVLFGGEDASGSRLSDTWEWHGEAWTQVDDTGPAGRSGHAMCYDGVLGGALLFGGDTGEACASDTWVRGEAGWTQLTEIGPAGCEGAGLVFTGASSILFGGLDATAAPAALFGESWELAGDEWTERQDIGPAPRWYHAMTHDTARGRVVLFGGLRAAVEGARSADLFADTWEVAATGQAPSTQAPGTEPPEQTAGGQAPTGTLALVSFTLVPDTIGPGAPPFTVTVGLNAPAPGNATVEVFSPATGVRFATHNVPAGALGDSFSLLLGLGGMTPGEDFKIQARLAPNGVPLTAVLHVSQ